jgi:hypothetical protein
MPLSEEEIREKIEAIQSELNSLVQNPQVDYQIGQKSVSASQKQEQLMKQLEYWEQKLKEIPHQSVDSYDFEVDQYGRDKSDYSGD